MGWFGLLTVAELVGWLGYNGRARGLSGLRVAVAELVGVYKRLSWFWKGVRKKKKNIDRVCVEPNVNAFKKENLSTPTKGRKEILYIQKFSYLMWQIVSSKMSLMCLDKNQ